MPSAKGRSAPGFGQESVIPETLISNRQNFKPHGEIQERRENEVQDALPLKVFPHSYTACLTLCGPVGWTFAEYSRLL